MNSCSSSSNCWPLNAVRLRFRSTESWETMRNVPKFHLIAWKIVPESVLYLRQLRPLCIAKVDKLTSISLPGSTGVSSFLDFHSMASSEDRLKNLFPMKFSLQQDWYNCFIPWSLQAFGYKAGSIFDSAIWPSCCFCCRKNIRLWRGLTTSWLGCQAGSSLIESDSEIKFWFRMLKIRSWMTSEAHQNVRSVIGTEITCFLSDQVFNQKAAFCHFFTRFANDNQRIRLVVMATSRS